METTSGSPDASLLREISLLVLMVMSMIICLMVLFKFLRSIRRSDETVYLYVPMLLDDERRGHPASRGRRRRNRESTPATCSICLGAVGRRHRTVLPGCGHTYHEKCIWNWLIRKRQCPMCRRRFCLRIRDLGPC